MTFYGRVRSRRRTVVFPSLHIVRACDPSALERMRAIERDERRRRSRQASAMIVLLCLGLVAGVSAGWRIASAVLSLFR